LHITPLSVETYSDEFSTLLVKPAVISITGLRGLLAGAISASEIAATLKLALEARQWRKRVRVERTGDVENAARRF